MRLSGNKWLEQKHKTKRKRRSWRKLHLGLDLVSGQIVCSDLTVDDIGDSTALSGLLDQIGGDVWTYFLRTVHVMVSQRLMLLPNALASPSRSRSHHPRTRF
jgi:hypothetical protein